MKVKIVSGRLTGRFGIIVGKENPFDSGLQWYLVKVDGLDVPVYYLDVELEILH